jgi:D-hydroxyproline dehydrogenase subunit beta
VVAANHGTVKLADGTELSCATIVAACGTDTILFPWLPIQKRKGHLLITDRYPGFVHHQLVELGYLKSAHKLITDSVAFNVQPRPTGQLLIGSSRQYGNNDSAVDQEVLKKMLERAVAYMPGLARLSGIRAWTGFRAATPDKLPLIGYTTDPTVFMVAGFEGLGITNAPGAARMLVDALLGRISAIAVAPYRVDRFDIRKEAYA